LDWKEERGNDGKRLGWLGRSKVRGLVVGERVENRKKEKEKEEELELTFNLPFLHAMDPFSLVDLNLPVRGTLTCTRTHTPAACIEKRKRV